MALEVKEANMPPLTTPATAILFMILFFLAMMGIPLLFLRLMRHRYHASK
jgi:predicted transporter